MATDRRRISAHQRGSALMLMPAAVLVLIVLAAIAVDQSLVFMQQRELVSEAQAAANDAAGSGLDRQSFYHGDRVEFSLDRARAAATEAVRARGDDEVPVVQLNADRTRVEVSLRAPVRALFAPAIPGAPTITWVTATASARLLSR